jgi:hypothetical protein
MICVMHVNRRSKTDKYANSFVIIFATKHFNLIIRPSVLIFLSICISMLTADSSFAFSFFGGYVPLLYFFARQIRSQTRI